MQVKAWPPKRWSWEGGKQKSMEQVEALARQPRALDLEYSKTSLGRKNGFRQVLSKALTEVNRLQQDAEQKTRLLLTGEQIELHQVMLAAQKAELALELTQTIRNKVVEAYQEIMRMQV
jgi:flagellar hook-basal body complex protein FliE